jgi:hypothetical protein
MPRPSPDISDPTKYSVDSGKRKNPMPNPMIVPPPMAQLLLSCFVFDMNNKKTNMLFKYC